MCGDSAYGACEHRSFGHTHPLHCTFCAWLLSPQLVESYGDSQDDELLFSLSRWFV